MILDQSLFFGMGDAYRDMRMDVDNMSYEVTFHKLQLGPTTIPELLLLLLPGVIGSWRAHRRCVHRIERRNNNEAFEATQVS